MSTVAPMVLKCFLHNLNVYESKQKHTLFEDNNYDDGDAGISKPKEVNMYQYFYLNQWLQKKEAYIKVF